METDRAVRWTPFWVAPPIPVETQLLAISCSPANTGGQSAGSGLSVRFCRYRSRPTEGILQSLLECREGLVGGDFGVTPARVAEGQLEQEMGMVRTATVTTAELPWVKSNWASRPGGCSVWACVLVGFMQRPPLLQSLLRTV